MEILLHFVHIGTLSAYVVTVFPGSLAFILALTVCGRLASSEVSSVQLFSSGLTINIKWIDFLMIYNEKTIGCLLNQQNTQKPHKNLDFLLSS